MLALGIGAAFGIMALSDKADAQCNSSGACLAGPLASARSAATASTIFVVTGAALLAAGASLVLFSPRSKGGDATAVRLAPTVSMNGGGVLLAGTLP